MHGCHDSSHEGQSWQAAVEWDRMRTVMWVTALAGLSCQGILWHMAIFYLGLAAIRLPVQLSTRGRWNHNKSSLELTWRQFRLLPDWLCNIYLFLWYVLYTSCCPYNPLENCNPFTLLILWFIYKYIYICVLACVHMCVHVCMLVCMHAYVCMYVYMYVCLCLCLYVCMCVCMYVCMYVCICLCMCVY